MSPAPPSDASALPPSLKHQTAQHVGIMLQQEPVTEEPGDGDQMQQAAEEAAAAAVGRLPSQNINNLHAIKPMEADQQLQHGPDVAMGSSSGHIHHQRRRSLDSAAYCVNPGNAGRVRARPAAEGPMRSWRNTSSLAKPFSTIQKLFQKVSKAVKSISPEVMNMNRRTSMQEDLGQHFCVYHHHHHHYHHNLHSLHEEDRDPSTPYETYGMPRRRRFSDSTRAAAAVHAAEALGPQGQSGEPALDKWWDLYDQADRKPPFAAPRETKLRAASKLSHGHANNNISSGLRGVNDNEKRLSKVSLQTGNAKDAEMKSVARSSSRLRRLSDSLSNREAALRQSDLARVYMGDGDKGCKHASVAADGRAVSRKRHSASFSKYYNMLAT